MKIVIAGGSGQVGTVLSRAFHQAGHEVIVLSRKPKPAPWRVVECDTVHLGPWTQEIEGSDALINLVGRSVNCRYGKKNRALITESRIRSTRLIGEAIAQAKQPPKVWLQASTATIYAHRYDAANDEATGILGGSEPNLPDTWKFSLDVANAWEKVTNEARTTATRKVLLRSAIVMSPDRGGAFEVLLNLARYGLGGPVGDGRQFVSWIHDEDFARAVLWLIGHEELSGAINISSPNPLPNAEFMSTLRRAWGSFIELPATKWMIEIGCFLLRTESELILKSRRVVPKTLVDSGFSFRFPYWEEAARDLCDRARHI